MTQPKPFPCPSTTLLEAAKILDTIGASDSLHAPAARKILEKWKEDICPEPLIQKARRQTEDDANISFDDGTMTSPGSDGTYVMGWIFVPSEHDEDNPESTINNYFCPSCGTLFQDSWNCAVDEECPHCSTRHLMPWRSDKETPRNPQSVTVRMQHNRETRQIISLTVFAHYIGEKTPTVITTLKSQPRNLGDETLPKKIRDTSASETNRTKEALENAFYPLTEGDFEEATDRLRALWS